jgi:HEAT repeat protein
MRMLFLLALFLSQSDPEMLIEKLRSDSVEDREDAFKKLSGSGQAVRTLLEKAARDPDREVAARAKAILRIIELREKLSPSLRRKYPGIEEKLDRDPHVATQVILDLPGPTIEGEENEPESVDPFPRADLEWLASGAIRGANHEELEGVCERLRSRQIAEGVPDLMPFLSSSDTDLRAVAAYHLGYFRYRAAIPGILKLLEDPWGNNRPIAAEALLRLEAREIIPNLREQLKSKDGDVQSRAAELLGDFGDRESVPTLLTLCRESKETRWGPLEALAKMNVTEAIPFLMTPAKNGEPGEKDSALFMLVRLKAREAVPLLCAQLQDQELFRTGWSLQALGEIGDPSAIPEIKPFVDHSSPYLSGSALVALAKMGERDMLPQILRGLKDKDSNRRWFAVRALGALRSREHVNDIIAQLEDPDVDLRWASIEALGRMGAPEALPALQKWATSPLKGDRDRVRQSIQAIGGSRK